MQETDKWVANQAIVFWIPVCQKEMQDDDDIRFVKKASKAVVAVLREIILTRGTQHLEPFDPDQQEETPNLAKAAFKCLHFVAQTIGNKIIHLVEKDVLMGIESSDVWQKEAGIVAFGSILVGPTGQALTSLIISGFSKVIDASKGCKDDSVRCAITWTLGQIFEFHHSMVRKLMVQNFRHVHFLKKSIEDRAIDSEIACHALSSFVHGLDSYLWVNQCGTGLIVDLLMALFSIMYNTKAGSLSKLAASEALCEVVIRADLRDLNKVKNHVKIKKLVSFAVDSDEYTIKKSKNICRMLRIIMQKRGNVCHFKMYAHDMMHRLPGFFRYKSVIVCDCEEVMPFFDLIVQADFKVYMGELERCCKLCFQYFEQHSEVYLVMLRVMVNVSRVRKKKMIQFYDKIIIPLFIDASDGQRKENWGPSISCICEIARAVGGEKFLKRAMDLLEDKTWFGRSCVSFGCGKHLSSPTWIG